MKKIKYIFLATMLLQNISQASLFWDCEVGIKQFRLNNFEFSKNYFENYILNKPNDKKGYFWLAKTYQKLEQSEENKQKAKEYFKKAFELAYFEKNIDKTIFSSAVSTEQEDYFDMASLYFEKGDFKKTELYADMILKINPKSASAYFIKAQIANINKNEENAKEYLNQAIILNNNFLKTKLAQKLNIYNVPELSKETCKLFINDLYYTGDIEGAIKKAIKLVSLDLNDIDSHLILANLYIENNNLFKAQEAILTAKIIDENNIQLLLLEAEMEKIKDEKTKELKTLLKIYKINPNNQEALLKLGEYYLSEKDWQNSKKYFNELININNSLYEGYFGYVYSLIQLGEINTALSEIKNLSILNPNASDVEYLYAKIYEFNGEFNQALIYLNKAILKSENSNYFLEKAKINYILANYPQMLSDLAQAEFIQTNSSLNKKEIEELKIKAYLKLEDLSNAKIYIENTTALDKNRIIYKYNLYTLYKLQGNELKKEELSKQLRKLKPVKLIDYIDLSEFYLEEKGLDSAINLLNSAIKKYPNQKEIYLQQIRLCYQTKNFKKLKQIINKNNNSIN